MRSLVRLLAAIGRPVIDLLAALGRLLLFALAGLGRALTPPFYPARFAAQVGQIGWLSLPVVGLTALFTGAALAQQIFVGGSRFNAESTVPAVTVIAIVRELGPVLAGLMVAGRVASAMAAEIGTMRVTEQIDALATLRMDPLPCRDRGGRRPARRRRSVQRRPALCPHPRPHAAHRHTLA
jgi:phospholipid/cholesterol/gamma-HCH transport system permease protein